MLEIKQAIELIAQAKKKLDAVDYKKMSLTDLCVHYITTKEIELELKNARLTIWHIVDALEKGILPGRFEDEGVDKIQIPQLGKSVYPMTKNSAKVINKEEAHKWLMSRGGGEELITQTINASQLAGYLKKLLLDDGIEAPADAIEFRTYQTMGSSNYTPK